MSVKRTTLCSLVVLLAACGETETEARSAFDADFTEVVVEIDYQEGAEPGRFDPAVGGHLAAYKMFRANVYWIYGEDPKGMSSRLTVPWQVNDMEKLAAPASETVTLDGIRALASAHRQLTDTATRKTFYVLYLAARLEKDGAVRDDLLGLTLKSEGIIALFMPNLTAASADDEGKPKLPVWMQQSTLIHEFGHAVGLFTPSVPLTADHHDAERGAHCTNTDCVMYYASEGAADLRAFVNRVVAEAGEEASLYGADCRADAAAAR